jgi:hypothetical protein
MSIYKLNKTNSTPCVEFDVSKEVSYVRGISVPVDALGFYEPIIAFVQKHHQQFQKNVSFIFDFEYYNTSSSKMILNLLRILLRLKEENGYDWSCQWLYDSEDDFMYDAGSDIEELLGVKILELKEQAI